MDPPLINESSSSVANQASYSLAEIWPFSGEPGGSGGGLGLRVGNLGQSLGELRDSFVNRDGSLEESTVTEQGGDNGDEEVQRRSFYKLATQVARGFRSKRAFWATSDDGSRMTMLNIAQRL
ncbi:hypothetical protein ACFX13_019376 [Malus domestica]